MRFQLVFSIEIFGCLKLLSLFLFRGTRDDPLKLISNHTWLYEHITVIFSSRFHAYLYCYQFKSQAPDVPELAYLGIFQLSRLSVNCFSVCVRSGTIGAWVTWRLGRLGVPAGGGLPNFYSYSFLSNECNKWILFF